MKEGYKRIRVNLLDVFRAEDLNTDWEFPDTEELRDALLVIKEVYQKEVDKIKRDARHEFLCAKYLELKERSNEGHHDIVIKILEEIVDYGRNE